MCWYTHPNPVHEIQTTIDSYLSSFHRAHKIIFACSKYKNLWIERGLNSSKAITILGGADKEIFISHDRKDSEYIGVCSSYYERKNPMLLLKIIKLLPSYKFIILGKDWEYFSLFDDLLLNGNVEYIKAKYEDYPKYYRRINVFLSTSTLEGGPIPLIEAMMCNCIPVVSDVGFCSEIITNGKNGFLFDASNPDPIEVCNLIEKAFYMNDVNIRDDVLKYNWDLFSKNILSQLN